VHQFVVHGKFAEFTMDDGSTLSVAGNVQDMKASARVGGVVLVSGGTCDRASGFAFATFVRQ
jgi:hypothetical protein